MNMMFGLMDEVAVPSGSVAMFSTCAWPEEAVPSAPNASASAVSLGWRWREFGFMPVSVTLVQDGLHVADGVAGSGHAHGDAVENGAGGRQRLLAVAHDALAGAAAGGSRGADRRLQAGAGARGRADR